MALPAPRARGRIQPALFSKDRNELPGTCVDPGAEESIAPCSADRGRAAPAPCTRLRAGSLQEAWRLRLDQGMAYPLWADGETPTASRCSVLAVPLHTWTHTALSSPLLSATHSKYIFKYCNLPQHSVGTQLSRLTQLLTELHIQAVQNSTWHAVGCGQVQPSRR